MTRILVLIGAMALASCTALKAQAGHETSPGWEHKNSYERQQEEYRKHGVDNYQNGPLPQTVEAERRKQQQREYEQAEAQREADRQATNERSKARNQGRY